MIAKILLAGLLFLGLSTQAAERSSTLSCNASILGGVDGFPWSVAKPFPWNEIQGVWQIMSSGTHPLYLKAKVVRSTRNKKLLNLTILDPNDCTAAIGQGVGFIDLSERNVVRSLINDGESKYQLKLALFDPKDLMEDLDNCNERVLAGSIQYIGSATGLSTKSSENSENIMLKKVSNDLNSVCKKQGAL